MEIIFIICIQMICNMLLLASLVCASILNMASAPLSGFFISNIMTLMPTMGRNFKDIKCLVTV